MSGRRTAKTGGDPPPLAGRLVLDMSMLLAGPECGCLLAEFGADVFKNLRADRNARRPRRVRRPRPGQVEHHHRPSHRRWPRRLLAPRRSLRCCRAELPPGVADRLGVGYTDVRRRRPEIVYVSDSAFGDEGPWAGRGGYEYQAQAAAGLETRFGGQGRPLIQPVPLVDIGTGISGAFAAAVGLLRLARAGHGSHLRTSLTATATLASSFYLHDYEGKDPDEPRASEWHGSGPLHRLYRASDGWFFFAGRATDRERLNAVSGLDGVATATDLEASLTEAFSGATVAHWVETLVAAGFGAHAVRSISEVVDDPWVQRARAHPPCTDRQHGPDADNGRAAAPPRTPLRRGLRVPRPGEDAAAVLDRVGLGGELDRLVAEGAVCQESGGPFVY